MISYDKVQKKWYASLTREIPDPDVIAISETLAGKSREREALSTSVPFSLLPLAYNPYTRMPVHFIYFDSGCKTSLTGVKTDGSFVDYDLNPLRQLNIKHYQLIDKLKSDRDKKKRGSQRWRRVNTKIRNVYRKMNTQTRHYLHCFANRMLAEHPDIIGFYIGDWDKRATLAETGIAFVDRRINRQVQNNNPLQSLVGYLTYKSAMQGKEVEKFDERGTTRACSCCGHVLPASLHPSVRVFRCPVCGFEIERDVNSDLNDLKIHRYALWQGLSVLVCLSIARYSLSPTSGKNQRAVLRSVVLNYQDARGL